MTASPGNYVALRSRALTYLIEAASEAMPTSRIPITSANRLIIYSICATDSGVGPLP